MNDSKIDFYDNIPKISKKIEIFEFIDATFLHSIK